MHHACINTLVVEVLLDAVELAEVLARQLAVGLELVAEVSSLLYLPVFVAHLRAMQTSHCILSFLAI
jgi:hypothetical protein